MFELTMIGLLVAASAALIVIAFVRESRDRNAAMDAHAQEVMRLDKKRAENA